MEAFVNNTTDCSMQLIVQYFDAAETTTSCGHCANCIRQKMSVLQGHELAELYTAIINRLTEFQPLAIKNLFSSFNPENETKIQSAIDFLLKEKYIALNTKGELFVV